MTYTKTYKQSVLDEARETLKRTSAENLAKTHFRYEETHGDTTVIYSEPVEGRVEKWKREMGKLEEERVREKERMSLVQELYRGSLQAKQEIAAGMVAVNQFATAIKDRMDDMAEEIGELRIKLKIAETRHDDLKKSFDAARGALPSAEIVDLPNPLKARRA